MTTIDIARNIKTSRKAQNDPARSIETIDDDYSHAKISADIMKKVEKAATSGELSPSIRTLITNINNDKYFKVKKDSNMPNIKKAHDGNKLTEKTDIIAYLTNTDVKAQVIKKVKSALQRGELTPSVTRMLLDKQNTKIIYSDFVSGEPSKRGKVRVMKSKSLKMTLTPKESFNGNPKNEAKEEGQQIQQASGDGPDNILQTEICINCYKPTVKSRKRIKALQNFNKFGGKIYKKDTPEKKISQTQLTPSELRLISCLCENNESKEETNKMIEAINLAKKIKSERMEKYRIKRNKKKQKTRQIISDLKTINANINEQEKALHTYRDINDSKGKLRNKVERRIKVSGRASLLAKSIKDIGKLGLSAACKFLGFTSRAVTGLKEGEERNTKNETSCSPIIAKVIEPTTQIEANIIKSKCSVKNSESNLITKKVDQRAKILRRTRRPLGFGCNQMLSQNKRPCSSAFRLCPRFQPKFLNVLHFWKHFCQLLIFVVAFAIWTSCLICM